MSKTQRSRSIGHVRELRARGVTFDKSGRARVDGRFISDRSLRARIGRIPKETLGARLEEWGVSKSAQKKLTPARVARIVKVSEKTAKAWLTKGGASDEQIDRVAARLSGRRAYGATWKHGRAKSATKREEKLLREAFEKFVRARGRNDPKAWKFYDRWRRIKDFVRDKLTRQAWKKLLIRLGRREGLQLHGMFSVMRFVLS